MDNVASVLHHFRTNLIDLSLRNRLLNFRPTKKRTIQIAERSSDEIYRTIVLREKPFWLGSIEAEQPPRPAQQENRRGETDDRSRDDHWLSETTEGPFQLRTIYEKDELTRRISHSYRESQTVMEEQGYTVLHLALHFLRWSESPSSDQTCLAPLLLIPVRLERVSGQRFKGIWTKEEVQVNEALYEKLKAMGIGPLPTFNKPDQLKHVRQYYYSWEEIAAQNEGWTLEPSIYLDFFNFTKIVMWKDLDLERWPKERSPHNHDVLLKLLGLNQKDNCTEWLSEDEADSCCDFENVYYVMDADPSQVAAIENIKVGHDLVLEGPPGTGKSQTIVNLIAESLAGGGKVLFVSEKMAALEVVKKRLDDVGLGAFCAELHSTKANKKDFITALQKALTASAPPQINVDSKIEELQNLKQKLNDYATSISQPFGPQGKSPFELLCMMERIHLHFEETGKPVPSVNFEGARNCEPATWNEAVYALKEMQNLLKSLGTIKESPWQGCAPVEMMKETKEQLKALIVELKSTAAALNECLEFWKQLVVNVPDTWQGIPTVAEGADLMCRSARLHPIDPEVLRKRNLHAATQDASSLIQAVRTLQENRTRLRAIFRPVAFDMTNDAAIAQREMLLSNWFILRHPIKYRTLRKEVFGLYRNETRKGLHEVGGDLEELADYLATRHIIEEKRQTGRSLFGNHWLGERSDCQKLQDLWAWIEVFHHALVAGVLNDTAIERVCTPQQSDTWRLRADQLRDLHTLFSDQLHHLVALLQPDWSVILNKRMEDVTLPEFISVLERWEMGHPKLHEWSVYLAIREQCLRTIAYPLIPFIEANEVAPEDFLLTLKENQPN